MHRNANPRVLLVGINITRVTFVLSSDGHINITQLNSADQKESPMRGVSLVCTKNSSSLPQRLNFKRRLASRSTGPHSEEKGDSACRRHHQHRAHKRRAVTGEQQKFSRHNTPSQGIHRRTTRKLTPTHLLPFFTFFLGMFCEHTRNMLRVMNTS